jgi:hypothetical protein
VSLARACLQNPAVDALSIVANSQPQELTVVGDFGLDAAGVRVVKGVSQDLARNPVDKGCRAPSAVTWNAGGSPSALEDLASSFPAAVS